jgi:hypothetical protein
MRKLLLVAAVAVVGLSACRKTYDCTYTYEVLGVEYTTEAKCEKCNKSDVQQLEDAGWECK